MINNLSVIRIFQFFFHLINFSYHITTFFLPHFLILFYHSFWPFFSVIEMLFLIPIVIPQIFNSAAELAMPIETPISDSKAEIETHTV